MRVDIRAVTDPNGTAGTPVVIPAGGARYGVANPSGAIPGGVGFVYGAPGTAFSLVDTGDALALYRAAPVGTLQDVVDFRSFNTNPNTPVTASTFVGFAGNSTQLEPTVLTAAANDTALNWCVSFYAAGVRGSRVAHTAGAMNGSCKVAVINEFFVDHVGGDDGKTFTEIAGPGGALIGGARLSEIEGKAVGQAGGNNLFQFTLPAGTRIPADGILLVVDTVGTTSNTAVPNFVSGVDVRAAIVLANLPEKTGGDSLQLISASNTLLDVLGHDVNGAPLDAATAGNGFAMYEAVPARFQVQGDSAIASLMRSPSSTDTDSNANDFRADPTPTPGLPNDLVNFTVTSISPDEAPNTVLSTSITLVGTDFGPALTAAFGSTGAGDCNVESATKATCLAVDSASPARVNVVVSNGLAVGAPDVTLGSAYTYTGNYNETDDPLEADYCNIQFPTVISVQAGQPTPIVYGRIFEMDVTNPPGAPAGVVAEVGYGPAGADPRSTNTWRYFNATHNVQVGNDDEFQASFVAPAAGNYSYVYRFSFDNGVRWTYCDASGAGSNTGLTFATADLGVMTVTP